MKSILMLLLVVVAYSLASVISLEITTQMTPDLESIVIGDTITITVTVKGKIDTVNITLHDGTLLTHLCDQTKPECSYEFLLYIPEDWGNGNWIGWYDLGLNGNHVGSAQVVLSVMPFGEHLNQIANSVNADPLSTWKASTQDFTQSGITLSSIRALMGSTDLSNPPTVPEESNDNRRAISTAPANFDSRVTWGTMCPSIYEVRDQGNCGCCWAFGAVNAMTDRYCISKNGTLNPHFSAQDVCSCCTVGGSIGCQGGSPAGAWSWGVSNGVVTGGNCAQDQVDQNNVTWCNFSEPDSGCQPYSIPECTLVSGTPNASWPLCGFHVTNGVTSGAFAATPACSATCLPGYPSNYTADKIKVKSYSTFSSESSIMTSISTYGPATASFNVYSDFVTYRSGIYSKASGAVQLGGHCVKVFGYNTTNTVQYWMAVNQWNTEWGNLGFFNIIKGSYSGSTGNCGFESGVVAGQF
jgi:cathepsin B